MSVVIQLAFWHSVWLQIPFDFGGWEKNRRQFFWLGLPTTTQSPRLESDWLRASVTLGRLLLRRNPSAVCAVNESQRPELAMLLALQPSLSGVHC